jgi:hypothetical protein
VSNTTANLLSALIGASVTVTTAPNKVGVSDGVVNLLAALLGAIVGGTIYAPFPHCHLGASFTYRLSFDAHAPRHESQDSEGQDD